MNSFAPPDPPSSQPVSPPRPPSTDNNINLDIPLALVRFNDLSRMKRINHIPGDASQLIVRCPKSSCDAAFAWSCERCGETVKYVNRNGVYTFYCNISCGSCKLSNLSFRCPSGSHGCHYTPYREAHFTRNIQELEEKKIVMALVGATGVGKSTFINALANYLQSPDLMERINAPELCLIHSKFVVAGKSYEYGIPDPDNEQNANGSQSNTQHPMTYTFFVGDTMIQILDTPGIADTRGLIQDRKNIQEILGYLTHFNKIHAIMFLMPPNETRLKQEIEYYLKEIIQQLHRDALKNILFGYTSSGPNDFLPGNTSVVLKDFFDGRGNNADNGTSPIPFALDENNQYCFESDAFRYLVRRKRGADSRREEFYKEYWREASAECFRLLAHIKAMTPHEVRETTAIYQLRRTFSSISDVISKIHGNIHDNILIVEDRKKEIELLEGTSKLLRDNLYVPRMTLKAIDMGYHNTICTHDECCRKVKVGESFMNEAQKPCHMQCSLPYSDSAMPNPEILKCTCMSGDQCNVCGHSFAIHMHTRTRFETSEIKVIDEAVQKQIEEKDSEEEKKRAALEMLEAEITRLRGLSDEIQGASAGIVEYLKTYSTIPYNDSLEQLLDRDLEQLQRLDPTERNRRKCEELRKFIDSYHVLKDALSQPSDNETPPKYQARNEAEANNLLTNLFDLPIYGQQIREVADIENRPPFKNIISPPSHVTWSDRGIQFVTQLRDQVLEGVKSLGNVFGDM